MTQNVRCRRFFHFEATIQRFASDSWDMKKSKLPPNSSASDDIAVSIPRKKAAGAAAGAVVGGVVGGPIGAVVGGIVGTLVAGNTKKLTAAGARLARKSPAVGKLKKVATKKAGQAMKAASKLGTRAKSAAKTTKKKLTATKPPQAKRSAKPRARR